MFQALAGGFLGIVLGMRHALEPDHLAAVSTLVSEERSPRAGAKLGALWGIGHTAALLAVGLALALLRAQMPERLAEVFEFGVALMLVGLGSRAILRAVRDPSTGPERHHAHGKSAHAHGGPADHVHLLRWTLARRPLLVGIVHGLAGSGALTALALAEMPSASLRVLYMTMFGAGSVLGMAALSGLAGWPLARIGASPRAGRILTFATGAVSAGLGIVWGLPFLTRWSL
jgi:ABC-type nickel/cobalt efflux system permease component RcnA